MWLPRTRSESVGQAGRKEKSEISGEQDIRTRSASLEEVEIDERISYTAVLSDLSRHHFRAEPSRAVQPYYS